MKSRIHIVGAFVFAVVIITGAYLYAPKQTSQEAVVVPVVSSASPTRDYIPLVDADEDGVSDWQEQFETPEALQVASTTNKETEPYEPPDTLTGQFGIELFQNFVRSGVNENSPPEEKAALVRNTLGTFQTPIRSVSFGPADITVSGDSSELALRDYGNEMASVFLAFSSERRDHELNVLLSTLQGTGNQLSDLDPIRITYQQLVVDLLSVPVPPQLIDRHLSALNATRGLYEDVGAFKGVKSDPLLALAYLNRYRTDADRFSGSFLSIADYLTSRGIYYTDEEPAGLAVKRFNITIQ